MLAIRLSPSFNFDTHTHTHTHTHTSRTHVPTRTPTHSGHHASMHPKETHTIFCTLSSAFRFAVKSISFDDMLSKRDFQVLFGSAAKLLHPFPVSKKIQKSSSALASVRLHFTSEYLHFSNLKDLRFTAAI